MSDKATNRMEVIYQVQYKIHDREWKRLVFDSDFQDYENAKARYDELDGKWRNLRIVKIISEVILTTEK